MEKSPESSPEFEFWVMGNPPSFPQPQHLLTADELFADGVILPLIHPLSSSSEPDPNPCDASPSPQHPSYPPPPPTIVNPSKKWKQIFRSKRTTATTSPSSSSSSVGSAAELNINIWPFSRSRSAGNAGVSGSVAARPRVSAPGRKSCSAPCSRSNSRGESPKPAAGRKWGPLTGGIPVGRSMPVWQLKRFTGNGSSVIAGGKKSGGGGSTVGMLNLNVNTCIGYGSQVSNCRSEDKDEVTGGDRNGGGDGGGGGGNGSLFNLKAIFSKKVY